jgi:hypothetical protein
VKLVPVKLRDLTLEPEDTFETALTHRRGRVVGWGWYPWDDGTGRTTRVRSVLVAYGERRVIHRAEMLVLVPADRTHTRISDETRWDDRLPDPPEPGRLGTIGERVAVGARATARSLRGPSGGRQVQDQRGRP